MEKINNMYSVTPAGILSGDPENEDKKHISMIPHLFTEFNNDLTVKIIYAGPGDFCIMSAADLRKYLIGVTKEDTKLCFENLFEGTMCNELYRIYQAIDGTDIRHDQIYFFSGALDNQHHYNDYCEQHNREKKFKIYGCNVWEYNHQKGMKYHYPDPVTYTIKPKEKVFLCFNRVMHEHRLALLMLIIEKKLLDRSFYSFFLDAGHGNWSPVADDIVNSMKRLTSPKLGNSIERTFRQNIRNFPLKLNTEANNNKTSVDIDDLRYFDNSYLSLVTETFFFDKNKTETSIFFTEKTFKPISMKHPFILVTRPHSLDWLRKMRYKTFHPFIDETYDTIENDEERLIAIVEEVERLSKKTPEEWMEWQQNIQEIVEHNHTVFTTKPKSEFAFSRPSPDQPRPKMPAKPMHLVTSGDSFSDNCGLRWPQALAQASGMALHNRGQGSSGNDWIAKTVIYETDRLLRLGVSPDSITVLPMWTNPVRRGFFVSSTETPTFEKMSSIGNRVNFLDQPENKFLDSDPSDGYILGSMSCRFNEDIEKFKREAITSYFPREALAIESYEQFLRVQWYCQSVGVRLVNLCWMDIMHYPWYDHTCYGKDDLTYPMTKDLYRNVKPLYEMLDFTKWLFWKDTGGLFEYVHDNNLGYETDGFHPSEQGYKTFAEQFVLPRLEKE